MLRRAAPEIPVADLPLALRYYRERLGFEIKDVLGDGAYAIVQRDHVALHLFSDGPTPIAPASVHIFADDIDGLCSEMAGRGASMKQGVTARPWGTRDFRVLDPSGNELKFTEA